jgi:hypothetical protein
LRGSGKTGRLKGAMSSNYDPDRVLRVECPECDAGSGERCKTSSGRYRNKHDYHANRKGVVYPEFARVRQGFSDPTRKANKVMEALGVYIAFRIKQSQCNSLAENAEIAPAVATARDDLFLALKEGFTHGK